jgi:putative transposase
VKRTRGLPVKELCRQHGFSEASYYLWRNKFGVMSVPNAKRLKELETENAQLKKLLAEQVLENEVIKDALRKNHRRTGPTRTGAPDDRQGTELRLSAPAATAGTRQAGCGE